MSSLTDAFLGFFKTKKILSVNSCYRSPVYVEYTLNDGTALDDTREFYSPEPVTVVLTNPVPKFNIFISRDIYFPDHIQVIFNELLKDQEREFFLMNDEERWVDGSLDNRWLPWLKTGLSKTRPTVNYVFISESSHYAAITNRWMSDLASFFEAWKNSLPNSGHLLIVHNGGYSSDFAEEVAKEIFRNPIMEETKYTYSVIRGTPFIFDPEPYETRVVVSGGTVGKDIYLTVDPPPILIDNVPASIQEVRPAVENTLKSFIEAAGGGLGNFLFFAEAFLKLFGDKAEFKIEIFKPPEGFLKVLSDILQFLAPDTPPFDQFIPPWLFSEKVLERGSISPISVRIECDCPPDCCQVGCQKFPYFCGVLYKGERYKKRLG